MERTILLKDLKFWLDTEKIKKVILLNYQNNNVKRLNQLLKYKIFCNITHYF